MFKQFLTLAACATLMGVATAQTTLDDFETDPLSTDWAFQGFAGESIARDGADGANSTTASFNLIDGGFSFWAERTFAAVVPADGNYKVTFFYKNGQSDSPMAGLKVFFNGGSAADLGSTVVTTWTAAETGVKALTAGDNVIIRIESANGGSAPYVAKFDEFILEPVAAIPIVAKMDPPTGYFVDGTATFTASATGGSGTFTQAEFDLNDDASVDFTDSTPGDGFTYDLDTTALADGAFDLKVTITDDAAGTGSVTSTFNVANTNGVVDIFSDGFEDWTAGNPTNWVFFNVDGNGAAAANADNLTIVQDTTDFIGGASSLKITFAAQDTVYRYAYRTPSFDGALENYYLWYWGKGGSDTRMYYFSSDDETTWVNTFGVVNSGSTAAEWNEAYPSTPFQGFDSTYLSVATHKFSAAPSWWDNVTIIATNPPPTLGANSWDLYR